MPEHAGTQKAPREPAHHATNQNSLALCLEVARLLFRCSRSLTNAPRVTSLHAAIVESNVMLRYWVVRGCVCMLPAIYAEPLPFVQTARRPCQHLTTVYIHTSQWRQQIPYFVTQLTRSFPSDRQHLLHSLAQVVWSIPGASK